MPASKVERSAQMYSEPFGSHPSFGAFSKCGTCEPTTKAFQFAATTPYELGLPGAIVPLVMRFVESSAQVPASAGLAKFSELSVMKARTAQKTRMRKSAVR